MPQNYDITHMSGGGMERETLRVDTWDADGDHWLYYFVKDEDRMGYELATVSREEGIDEEGLDTAKEAVGRSDYVLVS
ncbi:hypothetical protein [Halomicrococcus sp. NG-SE-24]|uniref:hypothetical protein n=1 Tax=Halomicrococcus sp. NG-SE-24 TaxID=3436928 RepID=UPI003D9713BF